MQTFLSIVFSLLLAWGCGYYAKRRGRNPTNWFIAGAFFGIFALITLFILPVLKPKEKQAPQAPTALKPLLAAISSLHAEKFWYYLDEEKKQLGPMSFDALGRAWNEGSVKEQTFVWNEAMENWQHFKEVIELKQQ